MLKTYLLLVQVKLDTEFAQCDRCSDNVTAK